MSHRSEFAIHAAAHAAGRLDPFTALRMHLIGEQDRLMQRKVEAYGAGDTLREAHLDGQIVGISLALRSLRAMPAETPAEEVR